MSRQLISEAERLALNVRHLVTLPEHELRALGQRYASISDSDNPATREAVRFMTRALTEAMRRRGVHLRLSR